MHTSRNRKPYFGVLDRAKLSFSNLMNSLYLNESTRFKENTFSRDTNSISYTFSNDSNSNNNYEIFNLGNKENSKSLKSLKRNFFEKEIPIDNHIEEYIKQCHILKEELKKNNDINQEKINSYERLNKKFYEIEMQNKVLNQQFSIFQKENTTTKQENENLQIKINEVNSKMNVKKDEKLEINEEKYQILLDKENFLTNIYKNLKKSNNDYDKLIEQLQSTLNLLNTKSEKKYFNLNINNINENTFPNTNKKNFETKKRFETSPELSQNFDLNIDKNLKITFPNEYNNSFNISVSQSPNIKKSPENNLSKENISDCLSNNQQIIVNSPLKKSKINFENLDEYKLNNELNENYLNINQGQFSFRNNFDYSIKNEAKKIIPLNLDNQFIIKSNDNQYNQDEKNNNDKFSKLKDLLTSEEKNKDKIKEKEDNNVNDNIVSKQTINLEKKNQNNFLENINEDNQEKLEIDSYPEYIVLSNENERIEEKDLNIDETEQNNFLNDQQESPQFEKYSKQCLKSNKNDSQKKNCLTNKINQNIINTKRPSYLKILKDLSNLQKDRKNKNNISINLNEITSNLRNKSQPNNNRRNSNKQEIIKLSNSYSNIDNNSFEQYNNKIDELINLVKEKENEIQDIREQFRILNLNLEKNHNNICSYREKYKKEKIKNSEVILSLEQLNGLTQSLLDTRIQIQNKYENEIKRLKNKINKNPNYSPEKDDNYFIQYDTNEYIFLNNNLDNLKEIQEKHNFIEIFNYDELKCENMCQLTLNVPFNKDKNITHLISNFEKENNNSKSLKEEITKNSKEYDNNSLNNISKNSFEEGLTKDNNKLK